MTDRADEIELEMAPRGRVARKTREQETKKVSWRPPALLPDPDPEEGYDFRWVRVSALGEDDVNNISIRLREGYEPVKASDHPEVHVLGAMEGRFKDAIVVGGLMLCKIPKEISEARADYYRNQAQNQMSSVDNNFMRQNDPRMPLFRERNSEVEFGKGKR